MSLDDPNLLMALYDGLASPPLSPVPTSKRRFTELNHPTLPTPIYTPRTIPSTPLNGSPTNHTPLVSHPPVESILPIPCGSLLPNQLPLPSIHNGKPCLTVNTTLAETDSLTREKKGKMPALSHLLSVGKGRVLSLAADDQYVYAGCQSAENEIVVCPPLSWDSRV